MKLYICYGTFRTPRPGGHPCSNAHKALREAGHDPELIKSYGTMLGPDSVFNRSSGREEAKRLTGKSMVPVLVTDDGEVINESKRIVQWASEHPASGAAASSGAARPSA